MNDLADKKFLPFLLLAFSVISIGQNLQVVTHELNQWGKQSLTSKHTFVAGSEEEARQSFYDKDMQKALKLVEKSSPDYLPIYHEDTKINMLVMRNKF